MEKTTSPEKSSQTDDFYNDLQKTIKGFNDRDLIIVQFIAKLRKKDSEDLAVGSHARGRRKINGD